MTAMTPIPDYSAGSTVELPSRGTWPAAVHLFAAAEVAALRSAEAAGRPLLVRGLPGVGKSQLARAAAIAAGRRFIWAVIDGRTEAQDLMWRFDAVQRLAEAQQAGAGLKPPAAYLSPGPLWAGFAWGDAAQRFADQGMLLPEWMDDTAHVHARRHAMPADDKVVVLLDEIDKADPDLPNALLEVLANDGFSIPLAGAPRVACAGGQRPLIIVTTNEERELPPAFLRRCFVITLALPKSADALIEHLVALGDRHQTYLVSCRLRAPAQCCSEAVLRAGAAALVKAREEARRQQMVEPATAEYLDLVRAVATLYPGDEAEQLTRLQELSAFALDKSLGR